MRKEAFIDRIFRGYGEEFFGKQAMDKITPEQVEEARCFAMDVLAALTKEFGLQKKGTERELFCNYVFGMFM